MTRQHGFCGGRFGRLPAAAAVALALAGCAHYEPQPLPASAAWHDDAKGLRVDASQIALSRLAVQRIELNAPLPIDAVAALAVLNDPQLQVARDRAGVARAQAFEAGLLPDPQFSTSRDIPQGQSGATTTAYNLGLSFDLGHLITRGAAVAGAQADVKNVDLQMLWQEWQTASSAELAYVRLVGLRERGRILQQELDGVSKRHARNQVAVQAGDLPRTTTDADLVEIQALKQKLADNRSATLAQRATLNALLGLEPTVELRMADLPSDDDVAVKQALGSLDRLSSIRPDLMALQAGYESQEQKVREAILSQYPSINVGFSRARDTSNVHTMGFNVSFSMPIFNGSRGAIAVARATRQQLHDEYRVRLAAARSDAQQAMANIRILRGQREEIRLALPTLERAARAAETALAAGNLTLPQAQAQRMALLEQRLALQVGTQQIAEQAVTLQLLTGRGVFGTATAPAATQQAPAGQHPGKD